MELIILKVFSPVACLNSIKILTSIAVNSGWPFHQLDFKNAYLYGDLTEEVYMQQHPRFVIEGENSHKLCRLRKTIHGL